MSVTPGSEPQDSVQEVKRKNDRFLGIGFLVLGLVATVLNMTTFTENSLAGQMALLYEDFGISGYVRPEGLGSLSTTAVLVLPAIYALTLYLTLVRWKAGKRAMWIPIIGAVVTLITIFGFTIAAILMHGELLEAISSGALPTPTPTST
ncbi:MULTISPECIES: DUF6264 family protein [unclassified Pseudoclavibacter]|uniref:DUF6264 family protein n=1 Tax=unclassified Pseudoclavibacter TaxID=2615177 RepID=UPI0011B015DC|nr:MULTISPECIES: DUF6264 family protein [unclassified Pseudoclavibacter]MBF4549804.1 hypothetical protein [Pseudoclavibacter sp. VKM Ac-2888]